MISPATAKIEIKETKRPDLPLDRKYLSPRYNGKGLNN
jgi:hypothetical protein